MKKHLLLISLSILVFALALQSCSNHKPAPEQAEKFELSETMMKTITTATAHTEPLRSEFTFYGKITVDNNKLVEVFPVVGGSVLRVAVGLGDYVKKGQVLATIRSTEAAGYEKDLSDARNDLVVANNNLRAAQELYAGKLNAEKDVLEAKSNMEKAESQLKRIQETYRIYNIRAGAIYEIIAPINGFIIEKKINTDMQLRSDRSDNVFDIAEISEVAAIANVNESDISDIKLGMDAFVSVLAYPEKIHQGKVDKLYTIIDPETKAMKVGIKLKNTDFLLKPEMRATIRITNTEKVQMLAVPSEAIIFDKSKYFVMIYRSRTDIETRSVEIFRQVGTTAYIRSGVKEGEQVISKGQLLVYDALND